PASQGTAAKSPAPPWHLVSGEDALRRLASRRDGLSSSEAARRLVEHGPNELQQTSRIKPWQILLRQFNSLVVWILIVAAGVA
ncbi:cation-transporting P-type ATPase, partial [Salmonella sp. SAL4450]|uniref:cation-transporting P-type ATPase n=1 Tax=Salmonella sp. SAL4450 TaxID=3159905 RepID=UPI00397AF09E